jgi:hypothetical protein
MHPAVSVVALAEVVQGGHLLYVSVTFNRNDKQQANTCYGFKADSFLEVN